MSTDDGLKRKREDGPVVSPAEPDVVDEPGARNGGDATPKEEPGLEDPVPIHRLPVISERPPQLIYQKKTGLCYDVRMRYHSRLNISPAAYVDPHPEDPRRTFRIYKIIAEAGLITDRALEGVEDLGPLMEKIPACPATPEQLLLVHTQDHLNFLSSTSAMSTDELVHETERGDSIYLNNDSHSAARLSCGGAIECCRAVVEGRVKNALAVIRPPGHHAEPGAPGGFCLFSNVSVAAKVMLRDYPEKVRKIAILDWDVHHGNGTQRAFMDDPRVLYISLHRYENGSFYPGSKYGGAHVVGAGAGEGYTVNIPWERPGMNDTDYITAFYRVVMPICDEFDPDLVIVSSGFDAATGDPIGGCNVSPNGYGYMTHLMKSLAHGKLVVCLEGGYNLDSISLSALAVTKVLLGDPPGRISYARPNDSAIDVIEDVIQIQSQYWKCLGPHIPDIPSESTHKGDAGSAKGIFDSLADALRTSESRELSAKYGFASMPLYSPNKPIQLARDQILASPAVYEAEKLVVILHDASTVWAYRDPISGMIRPGDSVVASAAKKYVDWAIDNRYGVLDISVPGDDSGRPGVSNYTDVQDLTTFLWDHAIKYYNAKNIVFIGIGDAYAGIVHLAGHRELRDRCDAIICFLEETSLKQVVPALDESVIDWFYRVSLIFAGTAHKCWDASNQKRIRKRFGRVIRSDSRYLFEIVVERFNESIEFILDSS